MDFPDAPHLLRLQEELWNWPRSRAALMVGAGLSRNAIPLPGASLQFPTWNELVKAMVDELCPPEFSASEQSRKRLSSFSALRIASEYEAAFGTHKLEKLIRDRTPDESYIPGELHERVMELPWVDVFTTNYDTLLERTSVTGRAYQTIVKPDQLTTALSPRLVKLHGSFPSSTPFIITEEDFRTYPAKFAPFVNTVRQSLLENVFVLLGFSGEDPNFLEWTGWIRDELKTHHASIYLVGILNLSPSSRRLLETRGITPIDLAPLFSNDGDYDNPHLRATEWFLASLKAARPRPSREWPRFEVLQDEPTLARLPKLLYSANPMPPDPGHDHRGPFSQDKIALVLKRWRQERLEYPGWLVLDPRKSERLWRDTVRWVHPLLQQTATDNPWDKLQICREIIWRLNCAMVPALDDWTQEMDALTESLHSLIQDGPSDLTTPLEIILGSQPKERLDAWLDVAFSVLRWARESYQDERWNQIHWCIGELMGKAPVHSDRFHYEQVLQALWNLDYDKAGELLQCWSPSPSNPLGQMWKAGALAELDQVGEAVGLLESALGGIRQSLVRAGQNIHLLSLEGWCMRTLKGLQLSLRPNPRSMDHASVTERWQELRAWDCDPWGATSYLTQALEAEPPHRRPREKSYSGFDPGTTSSTRTLIADPVADHLPAFAFIRVFESVGMPLRCRNIDFGSDNLKKACQWIEPFNPFWSPALLLRCNSRKAISENESISRSAVASMDPALVDRLYHWAVGIFNRALKKARKDLHDPLNNGVFVSVPEILSRLAFRLNRGNLNHNFELAIAFYEKAPAFVDKDLASVASRWFNRLFLAAETDLLMEWLPRLIKLDLPEMSNNLSGRLREDDLEPLDAFPEYRLPALSNEYKVALQSSISKLLRLVAALDRGKIDAGVIRLSKLHRMKLLDAKQTKEFGEVLWRHRKENGLPDVSIYHFCAFVSLPSPSDVCPVSLIKEEVFKLAVGRHVEQIDGGKSLKFSGFTSPSFVSEAASASYSPAFYASALGSGEFEWSASECKELFSRAREWWNANKKGITRCGEEFPVISSFHAERRDWVRLLAFGILPRLNEKDELETREIVDWLLEARDKGGLPQLALPYILIARKSDLDLVSSLLLEDLDSNHEDTVNQAAKGLWHWYGLASKSLVEDPPPQLISLLVWRVAFRIGMNSTYLMQILENIVRDYPKSMSHHDVDLLASGLAGWRTALNDESESKFNRDRRLDLCHRLTKLAGAAFVWRKQNEPNFNADGEKAAWQQFSGSSVIPEVRRGFEKYFCDQ